MKRFLAAAVFSLALIAPATAGAHNSHRWYWSEGRAENALIDNFDDVTDAACEGFGRPYKRKLYKHFDCAVEIDEGDDYDDVVLHVLGQRRFTLTRE